MAVEIRSLRFSAKVWACIAVLALLAGGLYVWVNYPLTKTQCVGWATSAKSDLTARMRYQVCEQRFGEFVR